MAQITFLAHETLHMSSLDPTNGMLDYVLGAPRIRWGGVREALGGPGGPWGVGSCKVYAPVNPHTKYMRIYGTAREREAKK